MSIWTGLWVIWGLAFALIEGAAIINDKADDTLSEHFRKWFRIDTKKGRSAWLVVSGGFAAWFVIHILMPGVA